MLLEKVKTNHGIHVRGPYKGKTAYIATFIDRPEYEKMVDWFITNYPEGGKVNAVHNQNKRN